MAYGAKSSDIKDISYLSHGVHENVTLAKVFDGKVENKEKTAEYDVMDLTFENAKGQYQYRMFNPEVVNPDLTDEQNAINRDKSEAKYSKILVYVASKIANKDLEIPSTVTSWTTLKQWFKSAIGPNYATTKLALKLVGNVYNGNASVKLIEGYFGWLTRMDSGKLPVLSAKEIASNVEYDQFMAAKAGKNNAANAAKDAAPSDAPMF